MKNFIPVALVLVLTTVACSSSSTSSPVTTAPSTNTITVTGVVPAAVNGVGQSDPVLHAFNVGQSGGTVTFTLTSAVETFPGGTLVPGIVMGLAVGTPTAATCSLTAGVTPTLVQAGPTGISGTLNGGAYCVQISDATIQQGPVAYTLVVVAPQ